MQSVKHIWSLIEGDAKFMRRINGWLAIIWIIMIPIAYFMHWLESVTFVSALSLWALVAGHWSAWQASRVEVEQQKEEAKDTDGRLTQRIIRESNLHPTQAKRQGGRTAGRRHSRTNGGSRRAAK